ncbi:porin family protein [Sulfurimonas sp. NW15]|uniref:outer membrane beta-barrel protein n=1 Tax=Sulfurimonas sp. NW15 TaxID=2922729 RepID=UPI003DA9FC6C
MKKRVKKIILALSLVSCAAMADDTQSLVGLEGGYSSVSYEQNTPYNNDTYKLGSAGVKVGAQNENYRIFAGARYYNSKNFDYMTTFGVELQYLINVSPAVNCFIGLNAGIVNIGFTRNNFSRTISDNYYGGDLGLNFHIAESMDLELGLRVMDIEAENTQNNITYKFNTLVSGYGSIIYKFKMN